jgi:intein/homing endonuclease
LSLDLQLYTNRRMAREEFQKSLYLTAKILCGYNDVNWRTHGDMIENLESSTKRKLIVMPRGTFKCDSPCQEVYLENGKPIKIGDIQPGDKIISWENGKNVLAKITAKMLTPERDMLEIKMRSGRTIKVSPNHPLMTIQGWKHAEELTPKTRLAHWAGTPIDQGVKAPSGHPWIVGMLIGDGSTTSGNCCLSIHHNNVLNRTKLAAHQANLMLNKYKNCKTYSLTKGGRGLLETYGLKDKSSWTKTIPEQVWSWSLADRREFIAAYFSCDGHCNIAGKTTLTTFSKDLAFSLIELLKTIGVFSSIKYRDYPSAKFYEIHVDDPISQANLLKCPLEMKKRPVSISPQDGFWRSVPKDWRKIAKPYRSRALGIRIDNNYDTGFTKFRKFANEIGMNWACTDEMVWDQVVSIKKYMGASVDIEVEGTHTFIANGLVNHNSSVGVVAYSVWALINNPNARILIDSEKYANSKNFIREIKAKLESQIVSDLFGPAAGTPWGEGEIVVAWRTTQFKEASVTASGVEAGKTGQHYDCILHDDLNTGENSNTPEACEKVLDHYRLNTSILEPDGTMVVIGTRYSANDVIGHILENEIEKRQE